MQAIVCQKTPTRPPCGLNKDDHASNTTWKQYVIECFPSKGQYALVGETRGRRSLRRLLGALTCYQSCQTCSPDDRETQPCVLHKKWIPRLHSTESISLSGVNMLDEFPHPLDSGVALRKPSKKCKVYQPRVGISDMSTYKREYTQQNMHQDMYVCTSCSSKLSLVL